MSLPAAALRPDWLVSSVRAVDFAALSRLGRTAVLVDVDNTLAGLHEPEALPEQGAALCTALDAGYIRGLCLVSNTGWGRAREERVRRMARRLGAEAVCARFWEAKPAAAPYVKALGLLGATPESAVMIGDQVFTDVRGARRLGIFTVLVEPIGEDGWFTRWSGRRRRERVLRSQWGVT